LALAAQHLEALSLGEAREFCENVKNFGLDGTVGKVWQRGENKRF
jgi:hypothetical protein